MLALQVSPNVSARTRRTFEAVLDRLPDLNGGPIRVSVLPELTVVRGKLLSGNLLQGTAVYAAAFIRKREIVLESGLRLGQLRLIFVHEIFHFVWARLPNETRGAFASMVEKEFAAGARGELGESAAVKKDKLRSGKHTTFSGRLWRDYVCESFCDTAAWVYGMPTKNGEFRLSAKWSTRRRRWFLCTFSTQRAC